MLDKTKTNLTATLSKTTPEDVVISAPNFPEATIRIVGDTPYCSNKMSSANRRAMMDKQMSGERSRKNRKREPKDFDAVYKGSLHVSSDGWYGAPAPGIRAALISACRVAGFAMTRAKLSVFVLADGFDKDDGTPLVRVHGDPVRRDHPVKLADGSSDIVSRAFFDEWQIDLHLRWDLTSSAP